MVRKKICMLGTSAVGKTSLVKRFVQGVFSEQYLTTIGVKIDKKTVELAGGAMELLLWDLNGEDRFQRLSMTYLRGCAGYLLVVDGTRLMTLDPALLLHQRAQATLGEVPAILLFNKADLSDQWAFEPTVLAQFESQGWTVFQTSAKMGTGVDEAFHALAHRLR